MKLKECLEKAAQAWCDMSTEHIEMVPELATVFAQVLQREISEAREGYVKLEDVIDIFENRGSLTNYDCKNKKMTNSYNDIFDKIKALKDKDE